MSNQKKKQPISIYTDDWRTLANIKLELTTDRGKNATFADAVEKVLDVYKTLDSYIQNVNSELLFDLDRWKETEKEITGEEL